MTIGEYLKSVQEAYDNGNVDVDTYDTMLMNAEVFADEDEEETD